MDVAVEILDMKGRKVAGKTVKAAGGEKKNLEVPVTLAIAKPRALERSQESLPLPGEDFHQDGGRPGRTK